MSNNESAQNITQPTIISISFSDRYTTADPIRILVGRTGAGLELKTAHWPPPLLEPTPSLYAQFLQNVLGTFPDEQLANTFVFVDAPITLSESGLRQSELGFPDIDPQNHLIGSSLKHFELDSRCRSSLEFFHALLWRSPWPGKKQDPNVEDDLEPWCRNLFRLERFENKERNLYEVHLGPLAIFEVAGNHSRPGTPQAITIRRKIKKHLQAFLNNATAETPLDNLINDDNNQRLLLTFLIGYLWQQQSQDEKWKQWKLFGEPARNVDGIWREGEVIGASMESPLAVTLDQPISDISDSLYHNNIWLCSDSDPTPLLNSQSIKNHQHDNDVVLANPFPNIGNISGIQPDVPKRFDVWRYSNEFKNTATQMVVTQLSANPQNTAIRVNPISSSLSRFDESSLYYLCPWQNLKRSLTSSTLGGINIDNKQSLKLDEAKVYRIILGAWYLKDDLLEVTCIAQVLAKGRFHRKRESFSLKFQVVCVMSPAIHRFSKEHITVDKLRTDSEKLKQVSSKTFLVRNPLTIYIS